MRSTSRCPCPVHDGVLPLTPTVNDVDLSLGVARGRIHDERAEASADVEHDTGQLARRRLLARRHIAAAFSAMSGGSMVKPECGVARYGNRPGYGVEMSSSDKDPSVIWLAAASGT